MACPVCDQNGEVGHSSDSEIAGRKEGIVKQKAVSKPKRFRYWVAALLDKLPGVCWANLVMWAEYGKPLRECRVDWACRRDLKDRGKCYCGKLVEVSRGTK